ncbi:MAG: ADP-ribosylglycohydrolase family protein [Oscillatoria sp. SIO1A7]|nr:ADP-ribosylglycohydrolase family protein [Oscillatoria sp. SIO1A7]
MESQLQMSGLPRQEQFSGCLIGQCLGDALGFRVEGHSEKVCRDYVTNELRFKNFKENFSFPFPFGQYTDDSQLARELLKSYVVLGGKFDESNYARRIADIFTEKRIVGRGKSTEAAALRLAQGVPWQEAGSKPPAAGNGSAMRAGPIGLFFFDNPQKLIRAAYNQGRITHQDTRCSAGSIAIAGAVALALRDAKINPESFLLDLSKWTHKVDSSFPIYLEDLINWLPLPPEEAVKFISKAGMTQDLNKWPGISPFVVSSVLWSLYSFLKTPDDYWETICTAIAVGGDVDTTAAMAGAISGAHMGLGAIPLDLAKKLNDRGTWGFTELVELADKCYELICKSRQTGQK